MKVIMVWVLSFWIGFFPPLLFAAWFSDISDEFLSKDDCIVAGKLPGILTKEGYVIIYNKKRVFAHLNKVSDEMILMTRVHDAKAFSLKVEKKNDIYTGTIPGYKEAMLKCF
ncbi:hypothetical protein OAB29_00515 [Oceanospirillaceae bacterium]|nr:hypothetical protein [Oceanospirillaceae bacterium]